MSPGLFEADLIERRRLSAWRRFARPDEFVGPPAGDTTEPYSLGYPRHSFLLRALLPIALAFLLFLAYRLPDSDSTAPRPAETQLLR